MDIYAYIYICIYICAYIYTYIYIYKYMYVYVSIYIAHMQCLTILHNRRLADVQRVIRTVLELKSAYIYST